MTDLKNMPCEDNDNHKQNKLEELWGNGWSKLTPKQRQLVSEILGHLSIASEKV